MLSLHGCCLTNHSAWVVSWIPNPSWLDWLTGARWIPSFLLYEIQLRNIHFGRLRFLLASSPDSDLTVCYLLLSSPPAATPQTYLFFYFVSHTDITCLPFLFFLPLLFTYGSGARSWKYRHILDNFLFDWLSLSYLLVVIGRVTQPFGKSCVTMEGD